FHSNRARVRRRHHRPAVWIQRCSAVLRERGGEARHSADPRPASSNHSSGRSLCTLRSTSGFWRGEKPCDSFSVSATWRPLRLPFATSWRSQVLGGRANRGILQRTTGQRRQKLSLSQANGFSSED